MINRIYGHVMNDWNSFLDRLVVYINQGLTDQEISSIFRGQTIEWIGKVEKISLNEKYVPGIDMNMGNELLPVSRGRVLRSEHIALDIKSEYFENWRECKVGDLIRFKARIPEKKGPFPEIRLSEFDGDPEVILMLGLVDCELVGILKPA